MKMVKLWRMKEIQVFLLNSARTLATLVVGGSESKYSKERGQDPLWKQKMKLLNRSYLLMSSIFYLYEVKTFY